MKKILIASLALAALALPAAAENYVSTNQHVVVTQNGQVVTNKGQRVIVDDGRVYVSNKGKKHCPPGLAKKGNGCLPPGHAKKMYRYEVGDVLEEGVLVRPVPRYALRHLDPAPYGYEYVRINNDILLVEKQTNEIDAIIALMNLTR